MVMIIPFNYTPDLCVLEVISNVLGHFLGVVVTFPALTLDSRRLCINRTLLAFKAMHKRVAI